MNGPEHYREAEWLLEGAQGKAIDLIEKTKDLKMLSAMLTAQANLVSTAQVHATLALAAATAWPPQGAREWSEVIS